MLGTQDIERGEEYHEYDATAETFERESLLPTPRDSKPNQKPPYAHCIPSSELRFGFLHLVLAFSAGAIACLVAQYALCGPSCFSPQNNRAAANQPAAALLAPPYAGSTERHDFPPMTPTNAYPSMFPTNVGYAGATPNGAEPALILTAPSYPLHTGAAQLIVPSFGKLAETGKGFDLFKKWGNLSPWYSVNRTAFGLDTAPDPPEGCRVTGLHFLHRHGARYPTSWGESVAVYLGHTGVASRTDAGLYTTSVVWGSRQFCASCAQFHCNLERHRRPRLLE
jgi:hypothetical protein